MRREEAISKVREIDLSSLSHLARIVAALEALGVLDLDEGPKAFTTNRDQCDRIDAAIAKAGWDGMSPPVLRFCGLNIQQAIYMAGLKIVEA